MTHIQRPLTLFLALGLFLGIGAALFAQAYTGSIVGRVQDQTGAVLPGTTVTINSEVLLQPQTALTSETGSYRFAELAIGTYTVTFEMPGFQTLIRENVILQSGATQTINAELALAQVSETVTVSSESPVVDVRETGIPQAFDNERLENIPSARDPWVILEQTPGMLMDRQNVGGNESGQQSGFYNRGTDFAQNQWVYDGVNITDMGAAGATPFYFDFGAFEEMNITTGGQDPSQQTSGTGINFIIKQGTNAWKGQGSFYGTGHQLQGSNIDDDLRDQGAGAGAPIKKILDYGIDVGGPILRDRAWIWGDYGVQDISKGTLGFYIPGCADLDDPACLENDPTMLRNSNVKFNLQITPKNKFNFLFAYNNKTRGTRGAADTRPLETTWRQSGPSYLYKFEDTHIVNDNLLFTGRYAYLDMSFALDYQDPSLREIQAKYDYSTGAYADSYLDYYTVRPNHIANFDGNYFLANALGGDHEFKFGFQFKKAPVESFTTYGGDAWAVSDGGEPLEVWMYRNKAVNYEGTFWALHFQDIYTKGNMTLKVGLRYDHQKGINNESQVPANMVAPDLMPAVVYPGDEEPLIWKNLSPRLGFTYDLTGDGKTIVKASYGRYYDLLDLYYLVSDFNPASVSEMDLPWVDLNGDGNVQRNEIDPDTVYYTRNFDPSNPDSLVSPNQRDPNLSAPVNDEFIVGAERELIPDFSFGVNYIYKRFSNMLQWDYYHKAYRNGPARPFVGIPSSAFVPATEDFEGRTVTYYELGPGYEAVGEFLPNWNDYHQTYQGLEFTGRKRLSNRWMMNFGITINSHKETYETQNAIYNPTGVDLREGGQVFFSGQPYINSKWGLRLDGMYEFPHGIRLAGKLNGRQGYAWLQTFESANRAGGIGRIEVPLEPTGEPRLDNLWYADLRLEKAFFFGRRDVSVMMDIFNLLNANPVLDRERRQNYDTANKVRDVLSPRVVRFGVRVRF